MTAVRLMVDPVRCQGHGICTLFCSERVDLDEWGYAVVDQAPIIDPRLIRRAHRAVAACPEQALLLEVGA